MSDPRHYRLYLGGENRNGGWHKDPATPKQIARLRYLGLAPSGHFTKGHAGTLIDQTELDPRFREAVEQWHKDKYTLHPDLYPPPTGDEEDARERPEYAAAETSLPVRRNSDGVLLGCLIFVLLPIAAVVGFGYYQAFLEQRRERPAQDSAREEAAQKVVVQESPTDAVPATPAPTPSAGEIAAVRREGEARAFAAAVSASQERALVKYPALGQLGSEINSRFNFRYKRMKAAGDPLLSQPDWPEKLADACAAARY